MKTYQIVLLVVVVVLILWSLVGYFTSNVEQAKYSVLKKADGYELREYPAHIVAQTTVQSTGSEALNEGFRIVAGYIFGGNVGNKPIAMTAPVVASNESRVISFGMPSSYKLVDLPQPTDSRVKLVELPTQTVAVLNFSWYRSDARVKAKEDELMAMLKRDNLTTVGKPSYAGYNAPWTPPWMTRNEILIEVK